MHRILFAVLSIFLCHSAASQDGIVIREKVTLFQIYNNGDTIDFIVVDTVLNQKKPIFLWCQGSLPQPLFGETKDQKYHFQGGGVANFDYQKIIENYHLIVISMPKTPVVVSKEYLNDRFLYVPDPVHQNILSKEFIEADYLNNYVERGNAVLDFLKTQKWVNQEELVVAGHSQGSKIATKIALTNEMVSHLGLFNPNPLGRIDEFVRQARFNAQRGRISWEKADSLMSKYYDFFRKANNLDSIKKDPGLRAWQTFSEPLIDDWLLLDIPIYMVYGTEDRASDLCDLVPLFFIQQNKNNLTL